MYNVKIKFCLNEEMMENWSSWCRGLILATKYIDYIHTGAVGQALCFSFMGAISSMRGTPRVSRAKIISPKNLFQQQKKKKPVIHYIFIAQQFI